MSSQTLTKGGNAPVPAGEIRVVAGHDFYDFEAKYLDEGNVRLECPADLPDEVSEEIAGALGMSLGTVKSSLHRALGRMRTSLAGGRP